jgi:mRNA interferase MazF
MTQPHYNFGEIILVSFPFSDGSSSKNRTAIVLCEDRQDCLVVKMTSNISQESENTLTIEPDRENNLKETTVIAL